MEYIYAAIFEANDDGSYTIEFPDLPGCVSEGKSLGDALRMAERALNQRVEYLKDKKMELPKPTCIENIEAKDGAFVNLVKTYAHEMQAVRRTVSIPKWMDEQAGTLGLSLSRVLQDALKSRLT